MMSPMISAPSAHVVSASPAVLDFPVDTLGGAIAALAVLALGLGCVALARVRRGARPASIPTSAAA